ncbi:hypothetical protein K435DRAFT_608751, partial [Dendrothele bispora CBS 962.96]
MIARCRSKVWIVKLNENGSEPMFDAHNICGISEVAGQRSLQRGLKGHLVVYPQNPSAMLELLPPPIEDLCSAGCVVFVGAEMPTKDWLKQYAKPLVFRKEKIQTALEWLKIHNPVYKDIQINYSLLNEMQSEELLPVDIDHILPEGESAAVTGRYDNGNDGYQPAKDVLFEGVVISDVSGNEPANVLRRAASKHVWQSGGSYIRYPHGSKPVSEFGNDQLFPMMYPCLFPYGLGGFGCPNRRVPVGMKVHVKH